MTEKQMDFIPRFVFNAYHLTENVKLKEVDRLFDSAAVLQSANRLVFKDGDDCYFFIYRFGSVIFFNIEPRRQTQILEKIKLLIGEKPEMLTSEEYAVDIRAEEKSSVGFERAIFDSPTLERIDLMSLILAQSTALEYFENKVNDLFRKTGDLGQTLSKKGRLAKSSKEILKFIGYCITSKQDLVANLYLLDKPDETWNDQTLDNLYRDAVDMFELKDRYKTLDYKLRMIQENLELISELLQNRNANTLEWTIIILIAVEIVLFVFQLSTMK